MNRTSFMENPEQRTLTVRRTFEAPLSKVWAAWTQKELLEKWWAPAPWKAVSKAFEFREGGRWHYYMEGPEGERHWCLVDYVSIETPKRFTAHDAFCDENANINTALPGTDWNNEFNGDGARTHVHVTLTFVTAEDMKRLVEMGFKQGFSAGLDQLDALLSAN